VTAGEEKGKGFLFGRIFYGWVIVAVAWLIMFACVAVQIGSFPVFFDELLEDFEHLGWTRGSLSLGFTMNTLFMAIFGPFAGFMLNRIGPKREVIVGVVIAGISIYLVSLTSQQWHFYVTYGILLPFGIAMAFYIPTVTTVRRWFSRRAGLAVSLAMTGSGLGIVVGPPAARALIDGLGWQDAYRVFAVILVVVVIACALALKRSPESVGTHPDGMAIDESAATRRVDFATRTEVWSAKEALKTSPVWLYMVAQAGYMVVVMAMLGHMYEWGKEDLQLGEGFAVAMVSLLGGVAVGGRLAGGIVSDRLMDRWGRKPVLYFSILGVIFCSVLGMWVDSRATMALFAAILGLTYGCGVGVYPTYLGDLYGVQSMPVLLGFVGLESATIGALGPWIFGTVHDHTGSYDMAFQIGLGACIASLLCLFLIRHPVKRGSSGEAGNDPASP